MTKMRQKIPGNAADQPAVQKRLYKYVTWHKAGARSPGSWVGQVRDPATGRQVTLGSGTQSQAQTARKVAKFLKVPLTSLKLASKASVPAEDSTTSLYRHVYKHSTPGCRSWRVYVYEAGGFQGTFPSEVAAAEAVARITGEPVSQLRKTSAEAVPAAELMAKYKALQPLYDLRHPGDIDSAIAEQTLSRDMFRNEPALELLSLLGKYGPWRRSLHTAWVKLQQQKPTSGTVEKARGFSRTGRPVEQLDSRAKALAPVILEAIKLCNRTPMLEWTLNCGAGVSHVLGFLPMLHSLKLIKHSATGQGRDCFSLGSAGTWYCWLGLSAESLSRLTKFTMAADALAKALACPPTTCLEWAQKCQQWLEALKPMQAPGLGRSSAYTSTWVFRVAAISHMRDSGIQELSSQTGRSALSFKDFAAAFPDQKLTLARLAKHLQHAASLRTGKGNASKGAAIRRAVDQQKRRPRSKASELCSVSIPCLRKALQTSCPVELLTCKLCLASSSSLRQFSCDYIRQHQESLDAFMRRYREAHGLWPSPSVLLSKFRDGQLA